MRSLFAFIAAFGWCVVMSTASGGVIRGGKKSLPLDKLPNAIMKTPENSHYLPDRIIVRLSAAAGAPAAKGSFGVTSVDRFVQRYGAESVRPLFPSRTSGVQTKADDEMSRVYVMTYSSPLDPFSIAKEVSELPEVDYAEPWFIYPVDDVAAFTPNDSLYSRQWGFVKVKADSAWGVSQGDTSVVIGIVDTGVQWDHPDLAANIWTNPGETGMDGNGQDKRFNGIDDDGNSYIDDWHGWDFAGADFNNPIPDNEPRPFGNNTAHGTHVAGIAAAVTNNTSGVAGIGFKCRILPVKTSADNDTRGGGSAYILAGFEGIRYAVDMGARIINCSWGGPGASQVEQQTIDYAVSKGSLVVAAAGNSNSTEPHYPASYDGVLSVAATNVSDGKTSYSNFGTSIDVSAPGGEISNPNIAILSILSTYYPNTYAYLAGTSMASPLAAGICALVEAQNPSFTGIQAGEQVRITCDNINSVNPFYPDSLGRGRVNAFRALTVASPSIRMTSYLTSDSAGGNNNGALEPNETFTIAGDFINYLQPTSSSATITLTTADTTVQILNGVFPIGALAMNSTANNAAAPFQVHIKSGVPPAHPVLFRLVISDGSYNDFQLFALLLNQTFTDHNVNNVTMTVTNIGRLGYLDITNSYGSGFLYAGTNELFEGGFLIGNSSTKIIDNIRNTSCSTCQDGDFVSNQIYNMVSPGIYAAQEGSTVFTDDGAAAANKIGLQVSQYSYEFTSPPDSDYVILRYDIKNTTVGALLNVYSGIFLDWDMQPNWNNNKSGYDATRSLGYGWDTTAGNPAPLYCGVSALEGASSFRGLELNTADISRAGKYSWISGGIVTPVQRGDVHMAIASGPYAIGPNQTRMIAFAILGGKSLALLQSHADAAQSKWNFLKPLVGVTEDHSSLPAAYQLRQNYPNPFNPVTTISYDLPSASDVTLQVFDVLGHEVGMLVHGGHSAGKYTVPFDGSGLSSGVYFYRLTAIPTRSRERGFTDMKKLLLVK